MLKLMPCLWLNDQAEEAARHYSKIFKKSKVLEVTRYPKTEVNPSGKTPGSVMTITLELQGQRLMLLNGGPHYKLSEAISFIVRCKDQKELDRFWTKLAEGGQEGPCGWLKDKYGLSWQVVPKGLTKMLTAKDSTKVGRMMSALLKMKKLDCGALKAAFKGK